jgi:lysozyme
VRAERNGLLRAGWRVFLRAMQTVSRAGSLGLVGLSAAALVGGCTLQAQREPVGHSSSAITVCAAGAVVQGVDVSDYQGTVDWPTVKSSGIDFAIARISDGSYLDTEFSTNWSGMKSAGLVRGAYQYFEPGEDPSTQASIVVSAVGVLGAGDLPVTADMETTGGQTPATVAANL